MLLQLLPLLLLPLLPLPPLPSLLPRRPLSLPSPLLLLLLLLLLCCCRCCRCHGRCRHIHATGYLLLLHAMQYAKVLGALYSSGSRVSCMRMRAQGKGRVFLVGSLG